MKAFPTIALYPLGLALLTLAPACMSVKPLLKATPSAAIANRLPALEVAVDQGPLMMNDGAQPEDAMEVFKKEFHTNLVEPGDSGTYGFARLVIKQVSTTRTGRALQAFQMITLMTPSVLGLPLEWYRTSLQAEVQITDANGAILGTYKGSGNSKVKVAMYHGYAQSDAPRLADIIAIREALAQIRPQLDTASARLRPLLHAGGTVENPIQNNTGTADRQ